MVSQDRFKEIVRIQGTNLNGSKKVIYALTKLKGVGIQTANIIAKKAGINEKTRLGFLSDSEISRIEKILVNLENNGIPSWMLNRRKDMQTGKDLHLIESDLVLQKKSDVDHMITMKSWRGYRHSYGLKVRGQKTRTTGRKKRTVGIKKKLLVKRSRV
jgi:small subunit ribosomal protein S13